MIQDSRSKIRAERGIAAITSILIIIILTLLISLAASTSGITEGVVSKYQYQAGQAYAGAESGAQDAMIRIARNKKYYTTDIPPGYYLIPSGCSLNTSSRCVKIIVEKDAQSTCSQAISSGQDCVISTGTLEGKSKTVEVILNVNATSGKLEIVKWTEI